MLHGLHYYESSKVFRFFQLLILMKFCVVIRTANRPMKEFENIRAKRAIFRCTEVFPFVLFLLYEYFQFALIEPVRLQSNGSKLSLQGCKKNFRRRSSYFLIIEDKWYL